MASSEIRSKSPLVVIVGPTASGKTATAIQLAKRLNGEIICADSRTIYKEMDVGTAKPSAEEQAQVRHWGIDLVSPDERFTVADFKSYALQKIDDIRERGKIPFLVGGTGLYVDSIVFDFDFSGEQPGKDWRNTPMDDLIVVGIATEKAILRQRIEARAEQLFSNSVVEEATILGEKYEWNSSAMSGNIYPIIHSYLEGDLTLKEAIDEFTTQDWRLAKRQMTWFRPNPFIEWCRLPEVEAYVSDRIASE